MNGARFSARAAKPPGASSLVSSSGSLTSESGASRQSSITVAVRVRPFTTAEETNLIKNETEQFFLGDGSFSTQDTPSKSPRVSPRAIRKIVNVVDDRMLIFDPPETNPLTKMQRDAFPNNHTTRIREHRFVFDKLFDVPATQEDVYFGTTRPLLDSVLDGYNATVFAYGATGCGKTHTILGNPSNPGVIFLTMKELYQKIEELSDTKLIDISLSFLEIYNETIRDLLNPETPHKKLVLREDSYQKISVTNLLSHKPESVEEVMELILLGNQNRTTNPTEANSTSSRSHAVLQINVIQKNRTADIQEQHTFATLSIIDLAGSERAAATKNRGIRLNEGANINKSLLALGNCINALCDPRRRNHVPYRDSKLTRLLKFSLGGNCKTVMIVCVSPSSLHYDETLNTLKYADRAKEIKTKLIRNQHNLDRHVGSYLKMITEQKQEIEELRARESNVINQTVVHQQKLLHKCFALLSESIGSIKSSLSKQNQEKWRKYFILAKRKILLLQRINIEDLIMGFTKVLDHFDNLDDVNTMMQLCEQLINKVDSQISELETQYSKPSELDHVLLGSATQILKRLKENEGWTDSHSLIFDFMIDSLKESLERDILFNSSILFDHLVYQLRDFNFISNEFINMTSLFATFGNDSTELKKHFDLINNNVITALELLANGDFDIAIEQSTSQFMQEKIREQDSILADDLNSPEDLEGLSDGDSPTSKSSARAQTGTFSNKAFRESKRGPLSPLKASPPRNFKKVISKKPLTPKYSPRKNAPKKVRWDVPKSDSTMMESDVSMDDSMQNISMNKSEIEDDSPLGNSIIHKTILGDELDLKFDPTLEASPVSLAPPKDRLDDILKADNSTKSGHFHNKRLSINLESGRNTPINSANLETKHNSNIPLLNKLASTKVIASNNGYSNIPTPTINPTPGTIIMDSMKRYGNLEEGVEARNIESNGSDKVD
ncbi:kinesin-domain-containing protein [Suhomyces tanzawaensis NRRL Y-17324]|uniref:Kinesin-like protein n=1 Tax=Suhomyces tanzawaensis NRRL Y-17324 TaxID=984487 RepID=A0A1E4SIE2_9ASCO|nr:kinesin-domain-containing protein [Suhomyces tanzawaensis NRRL Y-17324]ODV79240.1 kinesin-domain-containing protein [Suhomyces tanzawaensis NRRL Y-17324]